VFYASNSKTDPLNSAAVPADQASAAKIPDFVTTQALATQAGATAVTKFLWDGLTNVAGSWADSAYVPLAIAGLLLFAVFVPTLWESINAGKKLQAFIFGGANVLILWFAVLGSQAAADKIT
jgi:hypothetical protein